MGRGIASIAMISLLIYSCQGVTLRSVAPPASLALQTTLSITHADQQFEVSASLNQAGSLYYALYDVDPGTLSAQQVKAAAQTTPSGTLVASGTLTYASANVSQAVPFVGLPEKKRYTLFIASENSNALDASVKKIEDLIPNWGSKQSYNTAIAGKGGIEMRYWIHTPVGYYNDSANWPLLVYLHGGGEINYVAGNDPTESEWSKMYNNPFHARVVSGIDNYPVIQASVQINSNSFATTNMTEPSAFNEFIDHLVAQYRVDPKRVYLVGMSWGGSGVWNTLQAYPTKVAAAVPVAALNAHNSAALCASVGAQDTSVWAFINVGDGWFDEVNQQTAITDVQGCSGYTGDARVTVFDSTTYPATVGVGHYTIEYVFNTPFYDYTPARWYYWNGSAGVLDAIPPATPTRQIALAPETLSGLSAASTLHGKTLNSVVDWLLLFSRP